jgi:hypothetical protein
VLAPPEAQVHGEHERAQHQRAAGHEQAQAMMAAEQNQLAGHVDRQPEQPGPAFHIWADLGRSLAPSTPSWSELPGAAMRHWARTYNEAITHSRSTILAIVAWYTSQARCS